MRKKIILFIFIVVLVVSFKWITNYIALQKSYSGQSSTTFSIQSNDNLSSSMLKIKINLQGQYKQGDHTNALVEFYSSVGNVFKTSNVFFKYNNGIFSGSVVFNKGINFFDQYALFIKPDHYSGAFFCNPLSKRSNCKFPQFIFNQKELTIDLTGKVLLAENNSNNIIYPSVTQILPTTIQNRPTPTGMHYIQMPLVNPTESPTPIVFPTLLPTVAYEDVQVLAAINQIRVATHLAPVKLNEKLTNGAILHSKWMSDHSCQAHQCPGEPDFIQRMNSVGYFNEYGEIIAGASNRDTGLNEVITGWMNSPSHKYIIMSDLGPNGEIGVSHYGYYWTVDFGTGE